MRNKKYKSNYYFDSFPTLAHFSTRCGDMILEFVKNFDPKRLEEVKTNVHLIEHEADELKHEVTAKLLTEFMTPIDREDIFELLRLIDDVTDAIEEISLKLYLYNVTELPEGTCEFMELTVECMKKTEECLKHFPKFMNKDEFDPFVKEVVKLEEAGDAKYIELVHKLYQKEKDPIKIRKAETLYTELEAVSDQCREVCRFCNNIALKNI